MLQSPAINKKVRRLPAGNKQIEMTKFIVDFVWPHTLDESMPCLLHSPLPPQPSLSLSRLGTGPLNELFK